ncbi:MAG: nucleoside monophosphate kinase [bacterium]
MVQQICPIQRDGLGPHGAVEYAFIGEDGDIQIVLFLGAARCGKGTQANALQTQLGIPVFSLGNVLRELAAQNKDDLRFQSAVQSKLVDDEIVMELTKTWIEKQVAANHPSRIIVLDGPMRNLRQQEELMEYFLLKGYKVKVVWVTTEPEVCAQRPPRPDRLFEDTDPVKVKMRIEDFYIHTQPVRFNFRNYGIDVDNGNMLLVDNEPLTKREVGEQIIDFLGLPITVDVLHPEKTNT